MKCIYLIHPAAIAAGSAPAHTYRTETRLSKLNSAPGLTQHLKVPRRDSNKDFAA